jgi:hypothetical protein
MQSKAEGWRESTYQKELHVSWKKPEEGSKVVILKLKEGDFYSLEDPVSISIWEQLMAGKSLSTVLGTLTCTHADEDPAKLERDLDAFVDDLVENRLICPCPQHGAA